jgi:hypothetical protein
MTKVQKLLSRPLDSETDMIMEHIVEVEGIQALMEIWSWEGVMASSMVFLREDVSHLNQEQLVELVFRGINQQIDSQITFKETLEHVFVNYNFKVRD